MGTEKERRHLRDLACGVAIKGETKLMQAPVADFARTQEKGLAY